MDVGLAGALGDRQLGAALALDLDDEREGGVDEQGVVGGGPELVREGARVAEGAPDLLGEVRREGREQQAELRQRVAVQRLARLHDVADEDHHGADGRVEGEAIDALADGGDRSVQEPTLAVAALPCRQLAQAVGGGLVVGGLERQSVRALQEAVAAGDAVGLPRGAVLERAHEHLVEAHGVGAELLDDVVGVDDVAAALGHLVPLHVDGFAGVLDLPLVAAGGERLDLGGLEDHGAAVGVAAAVLGQVGGAEDHALVDEALERLAGADVAEVEQDLVPEAGVEQVEDGVLGPADVEVDGQPVVGGGAGERRGVVLRVHEAQVVPAAAGPLRHGVGLTEAAVGVDPRAGLAERGLAGLAGLEVVELGEGDGQLGLGDGHDLVVALGGGVVDEREGLAPVALPREQPVAQLVGDAAAAEALGLEPGDHGLLGLRGREAVEEAGVDGEAVLAEGGLADRGGAAADDLDDRQGHRAGEGVVALVVAGHGHDGAGAVAHEHVVGDPHRDRDAGGRVGGEGAGEHAGLLPLGGLGLAVALAATGGLLDVGGDLGGLGRAGDRGDQRVLGGEDHVGRAEQGVGAGREHLDRGVMIGQREADLGAVAAADPVALHVEHAGRPVEALEVAEQALGIGGDAHHPLAHRPTDDDEALLDLLGDLLVGQHDAQRRAPVDGGVVQVGEALAVTVATDGGGALRGDLGGDRELGDRAGAALGGVVEGAPQLQEDPLRPLVVARVGGVDLALPVVGEAERLELALEVDDALGGAHGRVHAGLHGVALGGQTEGVPAHRVQHVEAAHALVAGDDVGRGVTLGVADVEAVARRVREHVEDVVLGALWIDLGAEGVVLVPEALPAGLDGAKIVGHGRGYANRLRGKSQVVGAIATLAFCGNLPRVGARGSMAVQSSGWNGTSCHSSPADSRPSTPSHPGTENP